MAKKQTNGSNGGPSFHNGHVSLAREEYEAYRALDEKVSEQAIENAKLQTRAIEQGATLDSQAKHLSNFELKVMHLERINALQSVLIDAFKDKDKTLGLAELSEFWRQWTIHTSNAIDARKATREEVAKIEPDLFKSWRNWVNDYGKADRTFSMAGTRAEIEKNQPQTQAMMQTHIIAKQREELAKLAARVQQLEAEVEANKKKTPEAKQP